MSQQGPTKFVVVLLGGGATGKSSYISRLLKDQFEDMDVNDPTLFDEYEFQVMYEDKPYRIVLHDTAGQVQYVAQRNEIIESAHGYILFYDVTQSLSFEESQELMSDVCRIRLQDSALLPMILIANKKDCTEDDREVATEEAIIFSRENGIPFMEISTKTGEGVKESFHRIVQRLIYRTSMEGSLLKANTAQGRWSKRYFIIERNALYYFSGGKRPCTKGRSKSGAVAITNISDVKTADEETKKENSFVVHANGKAYYLLAQSSEERNTWMSAIRGHCGIINPLKFEVQQ